jgi:hypothetical protein
MVIESACYAYAQGGHQVFRCVSDFFDGVVKGNLVVCRRFRETRHLAHVLNRRLFHRLAIEYFCSVPESVN